MLLESGGLDEESLKEIVLSAIKRHGDEQGRILIEDLYRVLRREHAINRILAGKMLVKLYQEGRIQPVQYYYVRRVK